MQISRNSKKPFISAAIHETVHAIRSVDTGSYNQLKDVVYSVLSKNNEAYKGVWSEMYSLYKNEATDTDGRVNKDYISEELTAEVVSQLLTDEAFINEMAKTDRNFVQRIYDIIVDFFDKMMLRYTDNEKVGSTQMDAAVKQLQSEFESIKKMYKKALANTEAKRGVNMTLPKNLEKQNSILYNKKWHTDLTRAQLKIVQGLLRKAGNPETTRITDTANWYKGRIGGQDLFVIYSTEYVKDPTILYEVKGENANLEHDILMDLLEVIENGESVDGKSDYASWISKRGWMQKVGSGQNSVGTLGRGSVNRNAGVLSQKSGRRPSKAFRNVIENLFEVQYGKTRDGEDVRLSKSSSDDNGNTEQFRVMWTLEENVLNRGEVSAFYDKVSEMKNQKWHNYKVSKDGEYIFEIENKLVYFDGDYDYPEITTVVSFDTNDGTLLQYGKERVYECEEFGYSVEDALQIAEITLGEGTTHKSDFGDSRAHEREISRGAGKDGTEFNSQSGKDVKLSKSSVADPTENIEPPQEQTMSERSAASFELKAEVRRKLNEHIEKYGTLEKGVNPVRDVDLPKKTADDRYVRRGTRTVIESARITIDIRD